MPVPPILARRRDFSSSSRRNLEPLFGVRFVATEFTTGQKHRGRIDTLGLDQDGSPVIIEYKLTSNDNVINQGLFYLDWLMDHRGDFEFAARSRLGDVDVVWAAPRLILLAGALQPLRPVRRQSHRRAHRALDVHAVRRRPAGVDLLSREEVPTPKAKATALEAPATAKPSPIDRSHARRRLRPRASSREDEPYDAGAV